jgi:hypothetical protein
MPGIFISYRREDGAGHAGRLAEHLSRLFGRDNVFIDIDAIPLGVDFEKHIGMTLDRTSVTLVLIGDKWLNVLGEDGTRRIDEADDYVRKEIAQALAHSDSAVIPVLLEYATMPAEQDLPGDIAPLAKRNASRLGNEHWLPDVKRLTKRIDEITAANAFVRTWRVARRHAGLAGIGAAAALVAVLATILLSSSGTAAASAVRVDDIPVGNPVAQFHASSTGGDAQLNSTKPSIELKIHNVGNQTADVTRARITVANALRIRPCFTAGGSPLSATYQTVLPTTVGQSIDSVINEQVKPDQIDRFRIVFDLPLSAYGSAGLDHWLIRVHIQLLHDASATPVDAGYVILSFSGAPEANDPAMWWTKSLVAKPGYATLVKAWGAANIRCTIDQTPPVERFLAQSGRRSQELVDFAPQLTTST